MKAVLRYIFIVIGTVFFLFLMNIMLFCFVPSYRDMLVKAVGHEEETSENNEVFSDFGEKKQLDDGTIVDESKEAATDRGVINQQMGKTDSLESQQNLQIIDKEYHEDCGTGKGYWVITYSDGSTSVE